MLALVKNSESQGKTIKLISKQYQREAMDKSGRNMSHQHLGLGGDPKKLLELTERGDCCDPATRAGNDPRLVLLNINPQNGLASTTSPSGGLVQVQMDQACAADGAEIS